MGSLISRPSGLLLLGLFACKGGEDTGGAEKAAVTGETYTGLLRTLTFTHSEQTAQGEVSAGYDLDDAVTAFGDETGCGIPDMVSPEGAAGIDNNFARLLPALEATEAVAVYGLIQAAINSGELLLLFEVSGVDSLENDDDVTFTLHRGMGQPLLDTDDFVSAGQTLDKDPSVAPIVVSKQRIVDGALDVRGIESLFLPIQVFEVALDLYAFDAGFHVEFEEDGSYTGYFAGGTPIQPFIELSETANIDAGLAATLQAVLPNLADLAPNDAGDCQNISVTFEYTGVSAWLYADEG